MSIDVGTVFRWNNFPLPRYGGNIKPRWFICVGTSGRFAQTLTIYLCTTTTQLDKFQISGDRCGHDHHLLRVAQYPFFEEDSVIDFDERPYTVPLSKLLKEKNDIEEKGVMDEQTMRMIYNRLLKCRFISFVELFDIYNSFNRVGIMGLRKPKPRKPR